MIEERRGEGRVSRGEENRGAEMNEEIRGEERTGLDTN